MSAQNDNDLLLDSDIDEVEDEAGDFEDDEFGLDQIEDLDDLEKEEEETNMGHRLITADPSLDGDPDYWRNEQYFEQ